MPRRLMIDLLSSTALGSVLKNVEDLPMGIGDTDPRIGSAVGGSSVYITGSSSYISMFAAIGAGIKGLTVGAFRLDALTPVGPASAGSFLLASMHGKPVASGGNPSSLRIEGVATEADPLLTGTAKGKKIPTRLLASQNPSPRSRRLRV